MISKAFEILQSSDDLINVLMVQQALPYVTIC